VDYFLFYNVTECFLVQVNNYDGVLKCPQAGVLCVSNPNWLAVTSPMPVADGRSSAFGPVSNNISHAPCAYCEMPASLGCGSGMLDKNRYKLYGEIANSIFCLENMAFTLYSVTVIQYF
jgi:hypothetical protein